MNYQGQFGCMGTYPLVGERKFEADEGIESMQAAQSGKRTTQFVANFHILTITARFGDSKVARGCLKISHTCLNNFRGRSFFRAS